MKRIGTQSCRFHGLKKPSRRLVHDPLTFFHRSMHPFSVAHFIAFPVNPISIRSHVYHDCPHFAALKPSKPAGQTKIAAGSVRFARADHDNPSLVEEPSPVSEHRNMHGSMFLLPASWSYCPVAWPVPQTTTHTPTPLFSPKPILTHLIACLSFLSYSMLFTIYNYTRLPSCVSLVFIS